MRASAPRPIPSPEAFADAFGVTPETVGKLATYARLLRQWQKAVNLVAPATLDDVWHRHFADSAQLAALIPTGTRTLVDLGSGGGFPGLVLAIMGAAATVTLVESDSRKAAFLREVARQVGAPVEILVRRIEHPATQLKLATADVVTARALAPLSRLFGWIAPAVRRDATVLLLKGREVSREIESAERAFDCRVRLVSSVTDAEGRIVVVTGLAPKPKPED